MLLNVAEIFPSSALNGTSPGTQNHCQFHRKTIRRWAHFPESSSAISGIHLPTPRCTLFLFHPNHWSGDFFAAQKNGCKSGLGRDSQLPVAALHDAPAPCAYRKDGIENVNFYF